jgi:hypothetical protein
MTYTVKSTNQEKVNLTSLYEMLKVDPYTNLPTKKRLKNKFPVMLKDYSIISKQLGEKYIGFFKKNKTKKLFKSALTITFYTSTNKISVKVYQNKNLHISGLKNNEQLFHIVEYFNNILNYSETYYVIPCMCLLNFNLGFEVLKEELINVVETTPDYFVRMTGSRYSGLVISFLTNTEKDIYMFEPLSKDYKIVKESKVKDVKIVNNKYSSFIVFSSGSCMLSTPINNSYDEQIEDFLKIINENKDLIAFN